MISQPSTPPHLARRDDPAVRLPLQELISTLGRLADRIDRHRLADGAVRRPGVVARCWATLKMVVCAPFALPATVVIAWRAAANHLRIKAVMETLAEFLRRLDGTRSTTPLGRVTSLDASTPIVITSDLHRCVVGRLDLVGAQHDRALYEAMLDWYAARDFTLVENGDVEDFWMVGGSTWGVVYDVLRLSGAALAGRLGDRLRLTTYREHLRRIVDNNDGIYERITVGFARRGRYLRTIGNHDDVYRDDRLVDALRTHVGTLQMTSWIVLRGEGQTEAVITHGHVADGWNAPGRATLGKLSSWMADMVRDAPIPITPDDLAPPSRTRELLSGRRRNGLKRVNQRFGASSSYDSLDEELLFDALGGAATVGPWILMGHTHYPALQPASDTGARWWRYANSGHGLGAGMITALEWPGDEPPPRTPRLVAWVWAHHPEWADLVAGSPPTCSFDGRAVLRVELQPSPAGRRLTPVLVPARAEAASGASESSGGPTPLHGG